MPPPRPSPCLLCAFSASARPRPPRLRLSLLPRSQTAARSESQRSKNTKKGFGKGYGKPPHVSGLPGQLSFRFREPSPTALGDTVAQALKSLYQDMGEPAFLESIALSPEAFEAEWATFERYTKTWLQRDGLAEVRTLVSDRRSAKRQLESRLRYLFYAHVFGRKFTRAELENQKEVADLRYPAEWYPLTRAMRRTVHLHVGPTNSGKTYHALKRLEEADRGIYLGPLRLLADRKSVV